MYINTITIGLQTSGFAKHIKGSHIVLKFLFVLEAGRKLIFFFLCLFFETYVCVALIHNKLNRNYVWEARKFLCFSL
jgi:hypothetical protein